MAALLVRPSQSCQQAFCLGAQLTWHALRLHVLHLRLGVSVRANLVRSGLCEVQLCSYRLVCCLCGACLLCQSGVRSGYISDQLMCQALMLLPMHGFGMDDASAAVQLPT